jgi:hypothetical protein
VTKNPNLRFSQNRRSFFAKGAAAIAALFFAPLLRKGALGSLAWADDAPLAPIDPKNPLAMALGFNPDAKKVDTKKYTNKAGKAGKKQMCSTCMQYTPIDKTKGKCNVFVGYTVPPGGWCNSWSVKT